MTSKPNQADKCKPALRHHFLKDQDPENDVEVQCKAHQAATAKQLTHRQLPELGNVLANTAHRAGRIATS